MTDGAKTLANDLREHPRGLDPAAIPNQSGDHDLVVDGQQRLTTL